MMRLKRVLTLSSIASASPIIEFASRMGRTVVLSHLLLPGEFGISVAITVLLTSSELVTDISLDKFLMSQAGDDVRRALGAVHWLMVLRGIILAVVIFAVAPWIAQFFGASNAVGAFRSVGIILAIRAFAHFEIKQALRDFRYGRDAFATIVAQLAAFAAIYPAARGFGDHRAIVLSLTIEAIVYVVASHLLAQIRYSATASQRQVLRQALAFGLPLTLNGLGLAMLSQFDRALVGYWLGIQTLALYAVIFSLAVVPISLIFRIFGQLWMSFLARARHRGEVGINTYPIMLWSFAVVSAAYAVFVATTLDFLMPLIFGRAYVISPLIHALLTVIVWLRTIRGAPITLMLVDGRTVYLTIATLTSGTSILLAVIGFYFVPRVETMLVCVLIGDAISTSVSFWISQSSQAQFRMLYMHILWSLGAVVLAALCDVLLLPRGGVEWRIVMIAVLAILPAVQAGYGLLKNFRIIKAWFGFHSGSVRYGQ
jgi:O-antigen/teichoic acid export membrane protein